MAPYLLHTRPKFELSALGRERDRVVNLAGREDRKSLDAIWFKQLPRDGVVTDETDLAGLGNVSRAGLTQSGRLALKIQEELLLLPRVATGPDPVMELTRNTLKATSACGTEP